MKTTNFNLIKYEAEDGKVFDWKEPRYQEVPVDIENPDAGTKQEQEHLYAKTLFIGSHDSIDNYIEVDAPKEEE
jgi:hypothetical protein